MRDMEQKKAIVIGAGIVGLATARALALRGFQVEVFERYERATKASVRNFGMIWPIGQPKGALLNRAMRSRSIWLEVLEEADIWHEKAGSLHLAYHPLEWEVMNEFARQEQADRNCQLLSPREVAKHSPAANRQGLYGGLYSPSEVIVDPREALAKLPAYLSEKYGVHFHWQTAITEVDYPRVRAGKSTWTSDVIYICSGADFETLFPELFHEDAMDRCQIQMMRTAPQPDGWRIGPALCGGLTLIHYRSFQWAASLPRLKTYFEERYPEYLRRGIHVMAAQNGKGELILGDSHTYGSTFAPDNREDTIQLILQYLKNMASFKDETLAARWLGVYAKTRDGTSEWICRPQPGVTIVTGLGGAGMTLSFGLAEELFRC